MISTADFRNGMSIELEGHVYSIVHFQHVKPGKGSAFVRTRLRNVRTGLVKEKTFRAGGKVEQVHIEEADLQYLYDADGLFHFLNSESFEEITVSGEALETEAGFLKEGGMVKAEMRGSELLRINLPIFVELKVKEADPGVKGDTAVGGKKTVRLESGAAVGVPLFVNVGDIIKVDTRTGKYVERVST